MTTIKLNDQTVVNTCDIVYDLLPLYIELMCGEQSKLLVEQHMEQCPSCKNNYLAMTKDVSESSSMVSEDGDDHPAELAEQQRKSLDTSAVKVLKRIRKKWLLTTLATLLLVPLLWLGINQYRGIGLSYTNMYDYYAVGRFISAIEAGNYEKAFTYIDTAAYYSITKSSLQDIFSALPTKDDFQLVTSDNGDEYYTDGSTQIAAAEFEQWLENAVEQQKILQAANEDSPYNDMSYEEFVEVSKQNFIAHLQQWQELDYTIKGRGVAYSSTVDGTRHIYDYKIAIYNKHNEVEYGTIDLSGSGNGKFVHSSSSYTPGETFISLFTSNITIWE